MQFITCHHFSNYKLCYKLIIKDYSGTQLPFWESKQLNVTDVFLSHLCTIFTRKYCFGYGRFLRHPLVTGGLAGLDLPPPPPPKKKEVNSATWKTSENEAMGLA